MDIAGIQPMSLIDYPGNLCCTVFIRGCSLRCPYCHNASLIRDDDWGPAMPRSEVLTHLRRRLGLLDGVCLTGGEPLLHPELPELVAEVRSLGLKVKLDTNGTWPERLGALLNAGWIDYVALDYKAPPAKWAAATGGRSPFGTLGSTLALLRESGIDYEVRTTVVPGLLQEADVVAIARELTWRERYVLQQFRPSSNLLDSSYRQVRPYPEAVLFRMKDLVQPYVSEVVVRGTVHSVTLKRWRW